MKIASIKLQSQIFCGCNFGLSFGILQENNFVQTAKICYNNVSGQNQMHGHLKLFHA